MPTDQAAITQAENGPGALNSPNVKKRSKFIKEIKRNAAFYLMLLPGVIILIINNYLPMIGVLIPFKDYRYDVNKGFFGSLFSSEFVGWKNFEFLFRSPDALTATINTVVYNIVFMALDLIVPITLAILMSEMWNQKRANTYQTLMFFPFFISWIAVSYVVYAFFCNAGFFNKTILPLFGLDSVDYYSEPSRWPAIIIFNHLWHYTGYNMIIFIASIAGIGSEYYEAAALDGATKWQQARYVTLPMLKTTAVILTLLAVGRIFNGDFDLFYNVPKHVQQLNETTSILDTFVYNQLQTIRDVGMSSAAGIYQAIVGCVVVFISNLVVRKVDPDSALF
ncbi:MAG: ABC transmembrane type-1 domain-containing protein [Thermocaproicibacter melissae]|jgi:putative aldouronate transport system permease protein|uniref:ABC transporter permease n=1 Tax=Thermocaproicibacter melissae TaxID=2966552 RepID=UPI003A10387B